MQGSRMTKRAAIILAGGIGQRFQNANGKWQDKALATLKGKPLLIHVLNNIQKVVDESVVVVNDESRKTKYAEIMSKYQISETKIVEDLKINDMKGPLIAILTGLKNSKADYCLTIPSDMPLLKPQVANYLFREINNSYVAVPMWPNGRIETLLMLLERNITLRIAEILCQLGRSHPDDIIRGAHKVLLISPFEKIKEFDPDLCSFVNINSQNDLNQLQPRPGTGRAKTVRLDMGNLLIQEMKQLEKASFKQGKKEFLECSTTFNKTATKLENKKAFFWSAVSREYQAKTILALFEQTNKLEFIKEAKNAFLQAAKNYTLESEFFQQNNCFILAERARNDMIWCKNRAIEIK